MTDLIQKFFGSKLTTGVLVAALAIAGVVLFGGFGGGKETEKLAGTALARAEAPAPAEPAPVASEEIAVSEAAPALDAPTEEVSAATAPPEPEVAADVAAGEARPAPAGAAQAERPDPLRVAAAADASGANSFNRLLKRPASAPNASPARDGIHDTANPGTGLLQWPSVAFESFPKTADGNKVDWVKALKDGDIKPRYMIDDPNAEPFLLDLVIVRQVKGSMPNVVYPHLQHTQWLDCSNCHDEIFVPQKGANQISMAGILLGQKCGVCHGKVAFPVSDCRRCHAQPKTEEELRALASRSSWATDGE